MSPEARSKSEYRAQAKPATSRRMDAIAPGAARLALVRIKRRPEHGNFAGVRRGQPDGAVRIVAKKLIVDFTGEIARPDNLGSVDIGRVEDPFFVDAVIRAVSDEDHVLSRRGFELVQKVGAVGESPTTPALRIAEPLRNQLCDVEQQSEDDHARKSGANRAPENANGAQVANRLDESREYNSGGRREVVRPRPDYKAIAKQDGQQSEKKQAEARITVKKENAGHEQPARRPEEGKGAVLPLVLKNGFERGPRAIVGKPFVLIVEIFHFGVVVVNWGFRRLPYEHRGAVVEASVIRVRRKCGMTGDAPVVAGHHTSCKKQNDTHRNHHQSKRGAVSFHFPELATKPEEYCHCDRNAEKNTFVRAAVEKNRDSKAEKDSHCE